MREPKVQSLERVSKQKREEEEEGGELPDRCGWGMQCELGRHHH